MKLKNLNLKFLWQRGEIATILTLISVVVMVAGILAGTKIAEVSTEQRTQAQNAKVRSQSSTLSGCQIVDTDNGPGCWCAKPDPGIWQFHCFSGATRGTPASTACTNNCTALNTGGGGGGEGDGTGTPTDGKSCNLNSTYLTDSVGDCGTCILDTAGNRDFFSGFPCTDGQKASYWCNGGVSGGTKPEEGQSCQNYKTQCISAKKCTGKPITSPSPTGTDGKGGGGGGTPNPPPSSEPKPGGYLIVNAGGKIITSQPFGTIPESIFVTLHDWIPGGGSLPDNTNYNYLPFPTGWISIRQNNVTSYRYDLPVADRKDNPLVVQLIGEVDSPSDVDIYGINGTNSTILAKDENYTVCYFPTPKVPCTDTCTIVPTIVKYCNSNKKVNQIDVDLTNVTPEPTTPPAKLTFKIRLKKCESPEDTICDGGQAQLYAQLYSVPQYINATKKGIFLMGSTDDGSTFTTDLLPDKYKTEEGSIISLSVPGFKEITSEILSADITHVKIDVYAQLLTGNDGGGKTVIATCTHDSLPFTLSKDPSAENELGDLIKINIFGELGNYTCSVSPNSEKDTFLGSANADFDNAMDKWKSGEIDATEMSSFISQLTRTPGLQVTFCDPLKGECAAVF